MSNRTSETRTRWAIICPQHGQVFLSAEEYNKQMFNDGDRWMCPHCGLVSDFDDNNYEDAYRIELHGPTGSRNPSPRTRPMNYATENNTRSVLPFAAAFVAVVGLFSGMCYAYPKYNVYRNRMHGEAELARAQSNRTIVTLEARAKKESAEFYRETDSIRALGVAAANRIIGHSLKDNPEYLTWLKVEALKETHGQVIYIPTEGLLPITEASRLGRQAP